MASDGTAVVVGASLAGWRAVETLRADGFEGTLTLVGAEKHLPYDRPPLSKQVLAGTWPPEKAVLADRRRSSELLVHEVLGREAIRLDVEGRAVELDDGSIVRGTPSSSPPVRRRGPCRGPSRLGRPTGSSRCAPSTTRWRSAPRSPRRRRRRVVVIGAGFIGAEVASTCAALGCRVTVLEALEIPLRPVLGPELGRHCGSLYGAHDVDLKTEVSVAGVRRASGAGVTGSGKGAGGLEVELHGGETVTADVVVVGIGVAPSTGWLDGSGLESRQRRHL